VEKMLSERGITPAGAKTRKRRKKKCFVVQQIDKSTCQSYNHEINKFGYKGVANPSCLRAVEKLENKFGVDMEVEVQPTHCFDYNAQDALFHNVLKRRLRAQGVPKNRDDLRLKFQRAIDQITPREIQKGFRRAYSRNEFGDQDDSLIPEPILEWYGEHPELLSDFEDDINIDSEEEHE